MVVTDIPKDITLQPDDVHYVGSADSDTLYRQRIIDALGKMPILIEAVRKMAPGEMFRVVMNPEHAYLFRQAIDGAYKPFLHNGKKFVENVDLFRIPSDYVGGILNIVLMVNLASIAARLGAIEVGVRNIARLIADTQRGKVKGALNALALARLFSDPTERRVETISAAQHLVIELGALIGQLRSHINAMPNEATGWFDGFWNRGFKDAEIAHEKVKDDVVLLIDGIHDLLFTYHDLKETDVAKNALSRIVEGVKQAGLNDAIRKARLLPVLSKTQVPEAYLESFVEVLNYMDSKFIRINQESEAFIAVDVKREELVK